MKTKNLVFAVFALMISWMIELQFNAGYSNESGAPAAVTGSPGDANKTCARSGCHTGNAVVNSPGIITSTVPASGYVPGTTYSITASCSQAGINKWGFEISPQNNAGNLLGQLIITNTTQTKIKSTKYVTHTLGGSNGSGSKTWNFNWVAPAAGTGDVTFYGAFNYANNNGSESGDHIHTSSLLVHEDAGTTGIADLEVSNGQLDAWPNPVTDNISVKLFKSVSSNLKMTLTSLDGKFIKVLVNEHVNQGIFTKQFHIQEVLPAGIYLLNVSSNENVMTKKIMIL